MNRFEILYNPYNNKLHFRWAEGNNVMEPEWEELAEESKLIKYQNKCGILENCIDEIIDLLNSRGYAKGGLVIEFIGTREDYEVLQNAIQHETKIECKHKETYVSAEESLNKLKECYERIEKEFYEYTHDNGFSEDDERVEIQKIVSKYQETVDEFIPVFVIGNYSVGKSALVNALIGWEILPSHANPTTAVNVIAENGDSFSLHFQLDELEYDVEINGDSICPRASGKMDGEMLNALMAGTHGLKTEEEILHQMIENLNQEKRDGLAGDIRVVVPFNKSGLDTDKYSFRFIDSPGSNNSDEQQEIHRRHLEEVMDKQTNALPIFVVKRDSLNSKDSEELRKMLDDNESGFAIQNCIIVISKSDELVQEQLSEELPQNVKNWLNYRTVLYISQIVAIGEKKDGKDWVDKGYQQLYERSRDLITKTNPPQYNKTPCGRKMKKERRQAITDLLYSSGIPSLETEINYYANRYADYKKCTNGRTFLLNALEKADEKLQEAKDELEDDKKKKEEEQEQIRNDLKEKIENIKLPSVNDVVDETKEVFQKALGDYCKLVEPQVQSLWDKYSEGKINFELIENEMKDHCQKKLYDKQIKKVIKKIQNLYFTKIKDYMKTVEEEVTSGYDRFSDDTKKELEELFANKKTGPVLTGDITTRFDELKFRFFSRLASLGFESFRKSVVSGYANKFENYVRRSFNEQCIAQPAREYSDQIIDWSQSYKETIYATLNKDNAILSEYDNKIREMEEKIEDMELRLENLADVKNVLEELLPAGTEAEK